MKLRSLLFVPGDRPDRMEKALKSDADALILDLEDAVLLHRKPEARRAVANCLADAIRTIPLFVRINPIGSADSVDDLESVLPLRPDGIVLPKSESSTSVQALVDKFGTLAIPILPIATETASSIFGLGTYGQVRAHLAGLTWGAEDLPAAIGATTARLPDGSYTDPYRVVRTLALFGAHAAGVPAIETVFPALDDSEGLIRYAQAARRDGFSGMMAIHPNQIAIINAAFLPTETERAEAERVVAAFEASPAAGAVQLDGRMLDRPHLIAARRVIEQSQ